MPRNGISPQGDRKSVHINSQIREGKNAVIHHHLSGHEGFRHNVRKFYVSEVDHTRGEATVTVGEPRGDSWTVRPNNIEYWTVERDGAVIYDSRLDIPCDMEEYERAAARYQGREPPPSKPVTHQDLSAFKIKFMTDLPNWVCWRWEKKHSGFTKVPYIAGTIGPNSLKADSGLKATWRPHDVALESVRRGYDGIGFCLLESGVGAFDIDNCIDDAGAIHPWALALVKRAKSYTERTVGGKGLRIIGKTGTRELQSKHKVAGTPISVECYRWAVRFITISGLHLQGTPNELNSIDALLDEVHAELAGGTTASHTEPKPRE
jgi:hypothetical protein